MTVLCAIQHPPDEQAEPTDGLLCRKHRSGLDRLTSTIHDLLLELPAVRTGETRGSTGTIKRTKSDSPPAPANLHMLDLLDTRQAESVTSVLTYWTNAVAEARGIAAAPSWPLAQLGFLTRHHGWIAEQEAVSGYHDAMEGIRRLLRGALGTPTDDGERYRDKKPLSKAAAIIRQGIRQ